MSTPEPPASKEIGYWSLLKGYPDFTRLFAARNISLMGDWFNTLGLLALLRAAGDDSATSFGWVLIFKMLPVFLIAPFAGVISDRFNRKGTLIVSDALRCLIVLAMLIPWVGAHTEVLYALVILQAVGAAFSEPARVALIPDIVPPRGIITAGALTAASWSLMLALGSALGGLTVDAFGWQITLLVDAGTYLVAVLILMGIKGGRAHLLPQEGPRAQGQGHTLSDARTFTGLRDIQDGVRYLLQRPRVATMALVKTIFGGAAGGIVLILTVYGEEVFTLGKGGVLGVALLYTARSLGTGLGPFISRAIVRGRADAMEWAIGVGFLFGAIGYGIFPWVGHIALAFACVVIAHLGGATLWVFSTVRLQQMNPSFISGRVFATEQGLHTLGTALSTLGFGYLLDLRPLPLPQIAFIVSLISLGGACLWFLRLKWLGAGGDPHPPSPGLLTTP